ncbi:MAG: hypothetical protein WBA13_01370 [Microcoleaceae cyanobacterium]
MHLFTTQLNDIQTQIEALQAERNRLQDLENATAGALANLKAVVANVKGNGEAITQLKSAIMSIFPNNSEPDIPSESYTLVIFHPDGEKKADLQETDENKAISAFDKACLECDYPILLVSSQKGAIKSYDPEDWVDPFEQKPEFGTPDKPCPATTDGKCLNPECEGETFVCKGCGQETLYCLGGDGDELCNDCWTPPEDETTDEMREKIQRFKELQESQSQAEGDDMNCSATVVDESDEPKEASAPRFKKMFDGEPEPDDLDVVIYNDRVHRYENTLGIHFKLKREAKAWADQFEVKYHDLAVEIHKDDFESFGYVLKMTKGNPDDPQWWESVTQFDYSKSPQENSLQEKYHVLIQKDHQSETVEIESSDEAIARKNYQHLVESIPYAYIHLMSNKRGCVESHKPASNDGLEDGLEWCDTCDGQGIVPCLEMIDGIEDIRGTAKCPDCNGSCVQPVFTFMATGMGWLNVIHNGEVLGNIYSSKIGWELETGEVFETRDEAAVALFNSSSVAA